MKTVQSLPPSAATRRVCSALIVVLLSLGLRAATGAETPESPGRSGNDAERADALVARYGNDAAPHVAVIEAALERVARRAHAPQDRAASDAAAEGIARLSPAGRDEAGRRKLANAWSRLAELVRALDGPTPQYLEYLEIALNLDPDSEALRREVDYQRTRRLLAARRTEEAARIRALREAGRDPLKELPYIGGRDQVPTSQKNDDR